MIIFCSISGRCIKFKEEKIEQLEWKNILICLLFISEDPLTIKKIEETTGLGRKEVLRLMNELIKDYEDSNQPLRIYEIARGYKIGTKTKYQKSEKKYKYPVQL